MVCVKLSNISLSQTKLKYDWITIIVYLYNNGVSMEGKGEKLPL